MPAAALTIAQLCQREVVHVDQLAPLSEAARLMREHHVGALLVTGQVAGGHSQALGVVTDRDLVVQGLAAGLPADTPVLRLASRQLAVVAAQASLADAVAAMQQAGVRRLVVIEPGPAGEGGGAVRGLVSMEDLLDAGVSALTQATANLGGLAAALRSDIAREQAQRPPVPAAAPARPAFLAGGTPGMPWPMG